MERRLCGGTAIDGLDGGEFEEAGLGLTLAAAFVVGTAFVLALIPVAIALFQPAPQLGWLGGIAGILGAGVGGVKVLAMAWGAGARLLGPHPVTATAAFAD